MKLIFHGHNERYTVEQSLLNLFPGELPVYDDEPGNHDKSGNGRQSDNESGNDGEPHGTQEINQAVITLEELPHTAQETSLNPPETSGNTSETFQNVAEISGNLPEDTLCRVTVELSYGGKNVRQICEQSLSGDSFKREGIRRYLMGRCFFLAARQITGITPPWGMLSGVRPDKPVSRAFLRGESHSQIRQMLEEDYFVTPDRAALAMETGYAAFEAAQSLAPSDIAVYVGIPFCPTRCAYCSFVSQSVEKSFALVDPYVDALIEEIRSGGELAYQTGLRVRAFYMGGGTPAVLSPEQMRRILTAFRESFDTTRCLEYTVEAGRPDIITPELLETLRECGIDRVCVNPQSMEEAVLQAIGRRHSPEDTERAVKQAKAAGFTHINMDVIAGLPEDSPAGFARTLARCMNLAPDNLTVHTLALKKGSRILTQQYDMPDNTRTQSDHSTAKRNSFHAKHNGSNEHNGFNAKRNSSGAKNVVSNARRTLPDAHTVAEMLAYAVQTLRQGAYAPYYLYRQKYMSGSFENTGWTLPGAQCLYNILIMSELCGIWSFGAGASTKLTDSTGRRILRLFNPKYPEDYIRRPEKRLENLSAAAAFYHHP